MRATLLLCDSAQEVNGKLYVIGGGWCHLSHVDVPVSMSVAAILHLAADETDAEYDCKVRLHGDDDKPWEIDGKHVEVGVGIRIDRVVGRVLANEENVIFTPTFHGVKLPAGRFSWILRVDDEELARATFVVG